MNEKIVHPLDKIDLRRLTSLIFLSVFIWTSLIVSLLFWSNSTIDDEMLGLARLEAIASFNKDLAFRRWATGHGGVYVPQTERTPSSPYLSQIPEQNLVTPSGRKLTLMNPAYMLRQMMKDYDDLYGIKGRITSLKPLNPDNKPDEWERSALTAFQSGTKEKFEITSIEGKPYLRLIRPLVTSSGCLKCHSHQGYKVGDIRGGIGVSVPLEKYLVISEGRKLNLLVILGIVWLVGTGVIWLIRQRGLQRIYDRLQYEEDIWHQANFDNLTGLPNRNLFIDRLNRSLSYARRDGHQLALFFLDLDRFKKVNDSHGHLVGDALLQQAAERIQNCVRDMDTVSRLGGDEFTVILPQISGNDPATRVAEQLLAELYKPFTLDNHEMYLSASIGIAVFPKDGSVAETLLQNSDAAMYQAKSDGRNGYCYFNWELNQQAKGKISLESDLHRAFERGEFRLFYQPVFSAFTGDLTGAEALLRWDSPERGLVGPDTFIPMTEESGLIHALGDWVLNQSASDFEYLMQHDLPLQNISVNISTVQFRTKEFTDKLLAFLQQRSYLISHIVFEITESVFLDDQGHHGKNLESLREHGAKIAIDDFGTGYSSLGYLKRFPVDIIKIDRSFVRDISNDPEDASLCKAIIVMAHSLGLKVVAEGVETEQQLDFMKRNHCDYAQGFLLGRPMPFTEFTGFIKKNQAIAP